MKPPKVLLVCPECGSTTTNPGGTPCCTKPLKRYDIVPEGGAAVLRAVKALDQADTQYGSGEQLQELNAQLDRALSKLWKRRR